MTGFAICFFLTVIILVVHIYHEKRYDRLLDESNEKIKELNNYIDTIEEVDDFWFQEYLQYQIDKRDNGGF